MALIQNSITIPLPRSDIFESEEMIGKQQLLYENSDGDEIHCLNGGAAIIWLLCDGVRGVEEIAREIAKEFSLPQDEALAQVNDAVAQFQSLNLLESAAPR